MHLLIIPCTVSVFMIGEGWWIIAIWKINAELDFFLVFVVVKGSFVKFLRLKRYGVKKLMTKTALQSTYCNLKIAKKMNMKEVIKIVRLNLLGILLKFAVLLRELAYLLE